jgi:hypothetical protein
MFRAVARTSNPVYAAVSETAASYYTSYVIDRPERSVFGLALAVPVAGEEDRCESISYERGRRLPKALGFRVQKDLVRRAFFLDLALMQKDDPVGDLPGEAHFMIHDQHGAAFDGQIAHHGQHIADKPATSAAVGSSNSSTLGFHAQGAGNADALLLAPGKLDGIGITLGGEGRPFLAWPQPAPSLRAGQGSKTCIGASTNSGRLSCGSRD